MRPELCAFSPAEALVIMRQSRVIQDWFANLWEPNTAASDKLHIFFPTDPTTSWGANNGSASYRNLELALRDRWFEKSHIVHTLSPALGVIPGWKRGAIPLADFSGLRRPFTRRSGTRWDYRAYRKCLRILGAQLSKFIRVNGIEPTKRHVIVVRKGSIEAEIVKEARKTRGKSLTVVVSDAVLDSDAGRDFLTEEFMKI